MAERNGGDDRTIKQRRKAAREVMRDRMKGTEYQDQIDNDYAELLAMSASVDAAKNSNDNQSAVRDVIAKADCRAKIIKIKLDVNFRRLAKVLPDLKQIELAVDDDDDVTPVQIIIQAVDASAN